MEIDPMVNDLIVRGVSSAAQLTASSVASRIREARAQGEDAQVVKVQGEIIEELTADRDDLRRGFNALREQFVAQRLQSEQLEWISKTLIPQIKEIMRLGSDADSEEDSAAALDNAIDAIGRLLDPEFLEVMQVLGFNYKRAIGEPLTEGMRRSILRMFDADSRVEEENAEINWAHLFGTSSD